MLLLWSAREFVFYFYSFPSTLPPPPLYVIDFSAFRRLRLVFVDARLIIISQATGERNNILYRVIRLQQQVRLIFYFYNINSPQILIFEIFRILVQDHFLKCLNFFISFEESGETNCFFQMNIILFTVHCLTEDFFIKY